MRVQKPTPLSLLNGPFEVDGKVFLVMNVAVMLDFTRSAAEQEQTLSADFPKAPGSSGMLDEMRPKTRGESLVLGSAYAPGKKPAPAVAVRASVGASQKELWAVGDRVWNSGVPSDAAPFVEMPITWEGAFGGEGSAQNPLGKGWKPVQRDTGEVHPMPNIELAGKLVTSPRERPEPAGFGPLDPSGRAGSRGPARMTSAGSTRATRAHPRILILSISTWRPRISGFKGLSFPPGKAFWFENITQTSPGWRGPCRRCARASSSPGATRRACATCRCAATRSGSCRTSRR